MERRRISRLLWMVAVVGVCAGGPVHAGQLRAWGSDSDGQVTRLPTGSDYVAVAAGDAHGLALRSDGTMVAWGQNDHGECDVPKGSFRAVGAGAEFSLGIRTDGSLAAWGSDSHQQVSRVPPGKDFAAVDGGEIFAVALKTDGSLVAWGDDRWGQVSGAPKGSGFKAVVAGDGHAVALRSDGSLVSWGYWGARTGLPASGKFTALAAGGTFSIALRSDGSLVWWGADPYNYGLATVPVGNDYTSVAAGYLHGLALKKNGSVVGWGAGTDSSGPPNWGQAKPPAGNDYVALAGGLYFSLALTRDTAGAEISDDFNDNRPASLWKVQADDLANCWLDEGRQRLELRATTKARSASALYVGNGWLIDPTKDFRFKVRFHYSLRTERAGWVSMGLTPDADALAGRHIEFGAGCSRVQPHVWFESIGGAQDQADFADRRQDDGTLYVSYDVTLDKLYLSTSGYGAQHAWAVVGDVLQRTWASGPLRLYLGGGSDGLQIRSGKAYLDDFVVEAGGPVAPSFSEVHRFWSPATGRHFYTIDESEKDRIVREHPKVWMYEGTVFKAATTPLAPGLMPVYRFWSGKGQTHFYTIDENEKNRLVRQYSRFWTLEGAAFYAYPEGTPPPGSQPVYRFWRPKDGSHFYTISVSERDRLMKEYAWLYTFEGVAFYAYE